jgi:hypothetical protein
VATPGGLALKHDRAATSGPDSGPGAGQGHSSFLSLPHLLGFLILWLVTQAVAAMVIHPAALAGSQVDADGYLRLVRVELLHDTRAWFDGTIPRSNWPFGEDHHWTRPLDVLLLVLAAPLFPFMETGRALAWAGALVSPLVHLALCVSAVWIVRPLVPGPARFLAMPAMLLQMGLLAYGGAGRADHHALIFLLFALALGFWIRVLVEPGRRDAAFGAGMLAAMGIWVSPESLLPLALLFASGGLAWVLEGRSYVAPNLRLCVGLLVALGVAILLELPPSRWLDAAFDKVSVAHLTMGGLALAFWAMAGRAGGRPGHRLGIAAVGAVISAGLLRLVHPRFFQGPWVDVDPEVIELWLRYVSELQPLFPRQLDDVGTFLIHLGAAAFLVPTLVHWIRREPDRGRRLVWIYLLLSMAVYVPLAAYQVRFSGYAGTIFAVGMVVLVDRLLGRADAVGSPGRRRLLRVGGMAMVLLGPAMAGLGVGGLLALGGDEDDPAPRCSLTPMARVLGDPEGLGAAPRTIAAFIDYGPELLYRTPHRVLAGPYHRNAQGILGAYRLLTAPDDAEALALAREREVDWILLCPAVDQAYFGRGGEDGLYTRLLDGRGPDWIRPRELPPEAPQGFLLFEVDREPRGS